MKPAATVPQLTRPAVTAQVNVSRAEERSSNKISSVPKKTGLIRHHRPPQPSMVGMVFGMINMALVAGLLGLGVYLVVKYLL